MKQRKSEPDSEEPLSVVPARVSSGRIIILFLLLLSAGCLFISCENDLERIQSITSFDQFPDAAGRKYEILYSDSFRVKVRILAPEIERYARVEDPYIEFPKGLTAYFYDDSLEIEAYIKAKHVIYLEKEYLWEAKHNVEGRNLKTGNQLNTEHMFWDERQQLIYSQSQSRIVNEDGTFYGEKGFEARQDLSWYRLKKSKGVVKVKDE
jgi:LPS export ABC transporter protein LptC